MLSARSYQRLQTISSSISVMSPLKKRRLGGGRLNNEDEGEESAVLLTFSSHLDDWLAVRFIFCRCYDQHEISKLIKAFPKDIAALDKRSVLAKVNSQGSGT
jgi:hypothetical protein